MGLRRMSFPLSCGRWPSIAGSRPLLTVIAWRSRYGRRRPKKPDPIAKSRYRDGRILVLTVPTSPGNESRDLAVYCRRGWIMIRSSAVFLLALPIAATLTTVPAFAQYAPPPPPGAYYQERLPPVVGGYDDEEDLAPPPRNMRRGARALPYPDADPPRPPPGLYGAPGQRSSRYGQQPYQQPQQPPPMAVAPPRGVSDPDSVRPHRARRAAP